MGFFEEENKPSTTNPFDVGAARYLHKHLAQHRLAGGQTNIHDWANQFRLLRKQHTPKQIQTVLKWYVQNIHGSHVPQAHSARSFRAKFQSIKSAMRISEGQPTALKITPAAKALIKRLGLYWPPCVAPEDVLYVAQASLTAYADWLHGLYTANQRTDLPRAVAGSIDWFYTWQNKDPNDFVELWFIELHKYIHHNPTQGENFRRWAWHPNAAHYRRWAVGVAGEYGADPDMYDKILEVLE